jgi:hypothetical protein
MVLEVWGWGATSGDVVESQGSEGHHRSRDRKKLIPRFAPFSFFVFFFPLLRKLPRFNYEFSTPMTSSNPNDFPKSSMLNTVRLSFCPLSFPSLPSFFPFFSSPSFFSVKHWTQALHTAQPHPQPLRIEFQHMKTWKKFAPYSNHSSAECPDFYKFC